MGRAKYPPSIVLGVVLIAGLATTILGLLDDRSGGAATTDLTLQAVITGEPSTALDRRVEESYPWRPAALAGLSAFRYLVFRDLPDLVVGRDGFLFTVEEVERRSDEAQLLAERIDEIVALSRRVEEQGGVPIVLLLPSKARVNAEYLPRKYRNHVLNPRFDRALAELADAGVEVIDPREALRALPPGEGFFRRDTHWTPRGAAAAAHEIAAVLASPAFSDTLNGAPSTRYEALPGEPIEVPGDLMNFLPVGALRGALGLPAERAIEPRYARETAGVGLFGALEIPVLLTGTSYSADERWAFALRIGADTSFDVLNLAESGEGPFAPMRRLLDERRITEYGARIVVWEIPERYLTVDLP